MYKHHLKLKAEHLPQPNKGAGNEAVSLDGVVSLVVSNCVLDGFSIIIQTYLRENCLHLQLYRDSKDRYKQGQTKASLSLQHFLGVHSGFTLDKESNTIAIICQDVTVVLAFDTRERLIQWQVKIANNLGEDEQFLVQIQSAPSRGKLAPGPARLHVQERQFSMTVGVPPRLVGCWQIAQLRRYGVVEGRFCFEGGSRCGRGEGLYVLMTDQGPDMARAFQLAAEGRLHSRRRHLSRNGDSPRKRADGRGSVTELPSGQEETVAWPSCETRPDCDYADTASVSEFPDSNYQDGGGWVAQNTMERCMSCISKLGALSRSSTMAQTPGTPAWTSDSNNALGPVFPAVDSAVGTSSCAHEDMSHHESTSFSKSWSTASTDGVEKCQSCASRPFQPQFSLDISVNSLLKKKMKPPMPLPLTVPCHNISPYGNYDVPKPTSCNNLLGGGRRCCSPTDGLYDTPKQLRERCEEYSNYDTPQPVTSCDCSQHSDSTDNRASAAWRRTACSCQRIMSWMSLPYCHRGQGRENTAPCIQRMRLSGEGKMPTASSVTTMPIYATIDRSKKTNCRLAPVVTKSSNIILKQSHSNEKAHETSLFEKRLNGSCFKSFAEGNTQANQIITERSIHDSQSSFYINLEFAQSLRYYENSKDVLNRANMIQNEKYLENNNMQEHLSLMNGVKMCTKCGHSCNRGSPKPTEKHDDYLMMEPSPKSSDPDELRSQPYTSVKHFPGYLPMQPVSNVGSGTFKTDIMEYNFSTKMGILSASSPSLTAPVIDRLKKNSELSLRTSESTVLQLDSSISASSSPYLRRKLCNSFSEDHEPQRSLSAALRKRSNSADSARYIDDLDSITERTTSSSPTQIDNQDCSKNTSAESLCSQSLSIKRLNDVILSNLRSLSIVNNCTDGNSAVEKSINEVPYDKLVTSSTESETGTRFSAKDSIGRIGLVAHIRRSSSVPCKSGYNRDSSSSNDSGVSIGSLKQRGYDFVEFELPLTTSMSTIRHHHALNQNQSTAHADCFHASLPRRSKSSDPLRNLSFKFKDLQIPQKSSSAEAEVPICLLKKEPKGYLSPNKLPYIDSRSTSSGTSDMSDYIETLSLSSYSSSDTPDSLRLGRTAATTLRPRSGREYHKIDRYILDGDLKIPAITVIPQKSSNPESSECMSSSHDH